MLNLSIFVLLVNMSDGDQDRDWLRKNLANPTQNELDLFVEKMGELTGNMGIHEHNARDRLLKYLLLVRSEYVGI